MEVSFGAHWKPNAKPDFRLQINTMWKAYGSLFHENLMEIIG